MPEKSHLKLKIFNVEKLKGSCNLSIQNLDRIQLTIPQSPQVFYKTAFSRYFHKFYQKTPTTEAFFTNMFLVSSIGKKWTPSLVL